MSTTQGSAEQETSENTGGDGAPGDSVRDQSESASSAPGKKKKDKKNAGTRRSGSSAKDSSKNTGAQSTSLEPQSEAGASPASGGTVAPVQAAEQRQKSNVHSAHLKPTKIAEGRGNENTPLQNGPSAKLARWPSRMSTGSLGLGGVPEKGVSSALMLSLLQQQQQAQQLASQGSTEAEMHVIGELEAGQGFGTSAGLFCEISFEAGGSWLGLCRSAEQTEQTQTAYASVGDMYIWNHPIDLHYAISSVVGWPRCRLSVWKLTNLGSIENVSYGTVTLPTTPGHHEIVCHTWTPLGTYSEEFAGRLLGRRSGLTDLSVLDTNIGERMRLTTRSSGWVLLSVDIVLRNFERHGLSVISSLPASNALASQLFTPELQVPSAAMGGSPLYPYSASSNPGGPPSLVQRRGLAHSSSSVSYKTAESERGPVDAITTQQLFEKQGSNLGKKTV